MKKLMTANDISNAAEQLARYLDRGENDKVVESLQQVTQKAGFRVANAVSMLAGEIRAERAQKAKSLAMLMPGAFEDLLRAIGTAATGSNEQARADYGRAAALLREAEAILNDLARR